MAKQQTLRPIDIPVALRIAEKPGATFEEIHTDLGISSSTAHGAVKRLRLAGIVYPHKREVNRSALLEFLQHGLKYAFPAVVRSGKSRGVPTGYAAPVLAAEIFAEHAAVWPKLRGGVVGEAVEPLYEKAVDLPERCPSVYELLTLVDCLRMGRAREKKIAVEKLRARFGNGSAKDRLRPAAAGG